MDCVQFLIPPTPQFMTVGHSKWQPGTSHFRRNFQVYDLLFVIHGKLYITEEEREYEVGPGGLLLLEPGKTHWGHRACDQETEIYWIHFIHPHVSKPIASETIKWSMIIKRDTDHDIIPSDQWMFLPKFMHLNLEPLIPTLRSMVMNHKGFVLSGALQIHSHLTHLFTQLQALIEQSQAPSRSLEISKLVERYLQNHIGSTFFAKEMEKQLKYNCDYLARCIKRHTGMSPLQYLQYHRIELAKELLVHTGYEIPKIAEMVGVDDYNYFIRIFRKSVGQSPGVYRRQKHGLI